MTPRRDITMVIDQPASFRTVCPCSSVAASPECTCHQPAFAPFFLSLLTLPPPHTREHTPCISQPYHKRTRIAQHPLTNPLQHVTSLYPIQARVASPHQESDFAFFTKHSHCGSLVRFQLAHHSTNFPSPKKAGSSYNAFQGSDS